MKICKQKITPNTKISYCFYLETQEAIELVKLAKSCSLSLTSYITHVILKNSEGVDYSNIFSIKSHNLNVLDINSASENIMIELKSIIKDAQFGNISRIKEIAEGTSPQSELDEVNLNGITLFCKGVQARERYNLKYAYQCLTSAILCSKLTKNIYLEGIAHLYLARVAYQLNDNEIELRKTLMRAFECFNINEHPLEIAQVYTLLGHSYATELYWGESDCMYTRAKEILQNHQSSYYWLTLYRSESYKTYYHSNNISLVDNKLDQVKYLAHLSQSKVDKIDYLETLSKVSLFTGKIDYAYQLIKANLKNDGEDYENMNTSMVNSLALFVESKHNYYDSIAQMLLLVEHKNVEYPPSQICIYGAAKYINGINETEKIDGEKILGKLKDQYQNNVIGRVANIILETKQLKGFDK